MYFYFNKLLVILANFNKLPLFLMKSVRVTLETVIGGRVGNLACDMFLIPNTFSFGQVEGETNYVACYLNLVTE